MNYSAIAHKAIESNTVLTDRKFWNGLVRQKQQHSKELVVACRAIGMNQQRTAQKLKGSRI